MTPPAAPTLELVHDTGRSEFDRHTSRGDVRVLRLEPDAVWYYHIDGSAGWVKGHGDVIPAEAFGADGTKRVAVYQIDAAGNHSPSTVMSFTLDTTAPDAPTVTLRDDTGALDNDGTTLRGDVTVAGLEPGAAWEYSLDNGVTWIAGAGSQIAGSVFGADGPKTVSVRQTDAAGNVSAEQTLSFTLDTSPPEAPVLSLVEDTGTDADDQLTRLAAVRVGGLEPGGMWFYSVDGGEWLRGTGDTLPAEAFGADGLKSVRIYQSDAAGNQSSTTTLSFTLDTTAPDALTVTLRDDTGALDNDGTTRRGDVTVTGLEPGAAWEYSLDNGATWIAGAGSQIAGSVFGADGVKTVAVRQTDAAGNVSAEQTLSFTLDTSPPEAPVLSLVEDTGTDADDQLTRLAAVRVGGLEPGGMWFYSVDGGEWLRGTGDTLPAEAFGADGLKSVRIFQSDAAGNQGSTATLSFTLDTTAPSGPILTLAQDTGWHGADGVTMNGAVRVTGLEAGARWYFSVDGTTWTQGVGNLVPADAFTKLGAQSLQVYQVDAAGNKGDTTQLEFTLTGAEPPALTLSLEVDTGLSADDRITARSPVLVAGLEAGATWFYSMDDGHTWHQGTDARIAEGFGGSGDKRVWVYQRNADGVGGPVSSLSFTLDLTMPDAVTLSLAADTGGWSDDGITRRGDVLVGGLEPGAIWRYSLDHGVTWILGVGDRIAHDVFGADGQKQVLVRQTDVAGHQSMTAGLTFTLDTTPPPAVELKRWSHSASGVIGLMDNEGIYLGTRLEPGASWTYSIDGTNWISMPNLDLGSNFIPTSAFPLDGQYRVFVRQVDRAGNQSETTSIVVDVDVTPPLAPVIVMPNDANGQQPMYQPRKDIRIDKEPGGTWSYTFDGVTWYFGAADGVIRADKLPPDGQYTLTIRMSDDAGNPSPEAHRTVIIDSLAPDAPQLRLRTDTGESNSDNITNDSVLLVDGFEGPRADGFLWEYAVNDSAYRIGSAFNSLDLTQHPSISSQYEGMVKVAVRQIDPAGNVSADRIVWLNLDLRAPDQPGLALKNDTGRDKGDFFTSDGTIVISGLEAGATWSYLITEDGKGWRQGSGNEISGDLFNVMNSSWLVKVRQTDIAGNVSKEQTIFFHIEPDAALMSSHAALAAAQGVIAV